MTFKKPLFLFAYMALCFAAAISARAATGVAIGPAEVTISNLAAGGSYDLGAVGGLKWSVQNRGDATATITVRSVQPDQKSLPAGYEPVPDPAWLVPSEALFKDVGPKQTFTISATLKIPDGDAYLGKSYAAALEARTAPPGSQIGIGVAANARLLFTTADERAAPGELPLARDGDNPVSITTSPYIIDAGTVKAGAVFPVSQPVEIKNPGAKDVQVKLEQITLKQSKLRTAPGCESLPDGSFLVIENRLIDVPAGATVKAPVFVAIPDKPEYKGKTYAVVLNASVVNTGGISVGSYTVVKFKVE